MDLATWIQTAALALGALVAAYQFYLKDIFTPSHEPNGLDLVASMSILGERDEAVHVKAVLTAKNLTKRRVYVPAYWFTVRGVALGASSAPALSLDVNQTSDVLLTRYFPQPAAEVVAQRRIVYEGLSWWEPLDKTNDEAVFAVPAGKFDYLELRATYLHSRDGARLADAVWWADEDGTWSASVRIRLKGSEAAEELNYALPAHQKWADKTATGENWFMTSLSLLPPQP